MSSGKKWCKWVLDASMTEPWGGLACFCPFEGDLDGAHSIVFGMNFFSDAPPGPVIGVVHSAGQEAAERWCAANPEWMKAIGELNDQFPEEK